MNRVSGKTVQRRVSFLGTIAVIAIIVLVALVLAFPSLQQVALRSPQIAAIVTATLVSITNADRAKEGLGELRVNPQLVAVAQMKANDMAEKGYFAHVSPEGLEPWYWFREGGYRYSFAGENLAIDFADSEDVSRAWMESPKHRQNILDGRFTEIGIAIAQGNYQGRTTTFVVQMFGTPRAAAAASAPAVSTIPDNPTEVAVASMERPQPTVLSERAEAATLPLAVATTEPSVAAALAEEASEDEANPARLLFGYPHSVVRIAFNVLGVLLAFALAVETGLEIRKRHRTRALIALGLLVLIVAGFMVAEYLIFVRPGIIGA